MKTHSILLSTITATLLSASASACEFCACELPLITLEDKRGWHVGVSEQFTSMGTLSVDGQSMNDVAGQYLHSSVTQVTFGYNLGHRVGVPGLVIHQRQLGGSAWRDRRCIPIRVDRSKQGRGPRRVRGR